MVVLGVYAYGASFVPKFYRKVLKMNGSNWSEKWLRHLSVKFRRQFFDESHQPNHQFQIINLIFLFQVQKNSVTISSSNSQLQLNYTAHFGHLKQKKVVI